LCRQEKINYFKKKLATSVDLATMPTNRSRRKLEGFFENLFGRFSVSFSHPKHDRNIKHDILKDTIIQHASLNQSNQSKICPKL